MTDAHAAVSVAHVRAGQTLSKLPTEHDMNTDAALELVFADCTTASPFSHGQGSEVQHFRLHLLPATSTASAAQLELVGRYQELTITFYMIPASEHAKSNCIIDCKGLDPLLRAVFTALRVETHFCGQTAKAAADIRQNRKSTIVIEHLPEAIADILSLAARSQKQLLVAAFCSFMLPELSVQLSLQYFLPKQRKQRYQVQGNSDDLILVFPWEGRRGVFISANFANLAAASPYFARLQQCLPIDTVFGEIRTTSFKARRAELEMLVLPHRRLTWISPLIKEDLDAELCTVHFRDLPTRHNEPDHAVRSPTRYLVVNHHSSLAFTAVLTYLQTGKKDIAKLLHRGSAQTIPPRAVYRLAKQLHLNELAKLALDYYGAHLDSDVAISDIFSDTAAAFPGLASIAMQKVGYHSGQASISGDVHDVVGGPASALYGL